MAAAVEDAPPVDRPAPLVVAYDPTTGVPAEFNEFLPANSDEYRRWKALQDGGAPTPAPTDGVADAVDAATAGVAALAVGDGAAPTADAASAAPPPPKEKKPSKKKGAKDPAVVMEVTTRGKRKSVTVVGGLDGFGVKLGEAAKLFGKKFATGASVTKTAEGGEQIEVQGDVALRAGELVLATYGDKGFERRHFTLVVNKKKAPLFPAEGAASE